MRHLLGLPIGSRIGPLRERSWGRAAAGPRGDCLSDRATGVAAPRPGAGIALPRRGRALAGLRGVADGALAHVGEVPCGGGEVLVVVEHHQVVRAAVAQIIRSTADNARCAPCRSRRCCADSIHRHVPLGIAASGYSASNIPDICSYSSMVRAERRNSTRWG